VGAFVVVALGQSHARVKIVTMAWGSSFRYESPPRNCVGPALPGTPAEISL